MSLRLLAGALAGLVLLTMPVHAEEPPWSRGVDPARKAKAQKLLEDGNTLFLANKHAEALAKYTAAIGEWDHPAIRFNMVRSQVALERMLEAFENLEKALIYGAAPLEDSVYQEALNYQRLLARQVATLEVRCTQRGVTAQVDADITLACPETKRVRRVPGRHRIVASGAGFEPVTRELFLVGGDEDQVRLELAKPRVGRRWAAWKPWAVVAGGFVVASAGVVFNVKARGDADDLDTRTKALCPQGCPEADFRAAGLHVLEDKVDRENTLSVTGLTIGVAVTLLGGALVLINRDVTERAAVTADGTSATVGVRGRF